MEIQGRQDEGQDRNDVPRLAYAPAADATARALKRKSLRREARRRRILPNLFFVCSSAVVVVVVGICYALLRQ